MPDDIAVDAKRILLRYGAPISEVEKISDAERIALARKISSTPLKERQARLRELLGLEPLP